MRTTMIRVSVVVLLMILVVEAASAGEDNYQQEAEKAAETAKEKAEETAKEVKESGESWTDWAKEKMGGLGFGAEQTKEDAEHGSDADINTKEKIAHRATGSAHHAANKAGEMKNKAAEMGKKATDEAKKHKVTDEQINWAKGKAKEGYESAKGKGGDSFDKIKDAFASFEGGQGRRAEEL